VYFGNFEFADEMATKLQSMLPNFTAYMPVTFRLFYSGLAAAGMARKMSSNGKRIEALRYRAKAKRCCRRLGKLNRSNGPISHHRELLMLAVLNLSGIKKEPVSYERAINACIEAGHIHDAALGSELAGEFHLTTVDDKRGTVDSKSRNRLIRRHFTRARDLYYSWGAYAKVEQLQKTRGDYIEGRSAPSASVNCGIVDHENDLSSSSFSGNSRTAPMHNFTLLRILAGMVPSFRPIDILSKIPDKELKQHHFHEKEALGDDEMLSDIEMKPLE